MHRERRDRRIPVLYWIFPVERQARVTPLESTVVIGRDDGCQVPLDGHRVSRRHAEIAAVGPLRVLRDLGSTNGTFLDGTRVGEAPLLPGAVVRVGDHLAMACLRAADADPPAFARFGPDMLGGPTLAGVVALARQAARGQLPVVVEGETGTGKEKLARLLHAASDRSGPFVAVNCAALSRELLAAELFGWRRGAFTGADRASPGYFQAADGGTLLLDEVADLPLEMQGALLRVIQEREVTPLGQARPVPVDVKLVVATQTPLGDLVACGRFRRDLLARLDCWRLPLPPLRARREDIPFIVVEKIREASGVTDVRLDVKLAEALLLHGWPLNLRELDNVARRLAAAARPGAPLALAHLPETFAGGAPAPGDPEGTRREQDEQGAPPAHRSGEGRRPSRFERAFQREDVAALTRALHETRGNVAVAAKTLGIDRNRAYRLLAAAARLAPPGPSFQPR